MLSTIHNNKLDTNQTTAVACVKVTFISAFVIFMTRSDHSVDYSFSIFVYVMVYDAVKLTTYCRLHSTLLPYLLVLWSMDA